VSSKSIKLSNRSSEGLIESRECVAAQIKEQPYISVIHLSQTTPRETTQAGNVNNGRRQSQE